MLWKLTGFLIWAWTIKRYLTLDLHPGTTVEVEKKAQRPNYSRPGGTFCPLSGRNQRAWCAYRWGQDLAPTRSFNGQRQTELFFFHVQVFCQLKTFHFVIGFRCSFSWPPSTLLIPPLAQDYDVIYGASGINNLVVNSLHVSGLWAGGLACQEGTHSLGCPPGLTQVPKLVSALMGVTVPHNVCNRADGPSGGQASSKHLVWAGQEYSPAIGSFSLKLFTIHWGDEKKKKEETGEKFWPNELLFQIFPNSGGSREFRKQPQISFARLPHLCCLNGGRPRLDRKHLLDLQSWSLALRRGSKLEPKKKITNKWHCQELEKPPIIYSATL